MGHNLRKATAAAVRGAPCLHRFVLAVIADMANDSTGAFFGTLCSVAEECGTDVANVRRIVRRYEGSPNHVADAGRGLMGLDPGRFLYPQGEPSRRGQGVHTRYTFAVPAVPHQAVRRKPKNPAGHTSYAKSLGRFPKPTPHPPPEVGLANLPTIPLAADGDGYPKPTPSVSETYQRRFGKPTEDIEKLRTGGHSPPPPPPTGSVAEWMIQRAARMREEDPEKGQQSNASEAEAVAG